MEFLSNMVRATLLWFPRALATLLAVGWLSDPSLRWWSQLPLWQLAGLALGGVLGVLTLAVASVGVYFWRRQDGEAEEEDLSFVVPGPGPGWYAYRDELSGELCLVDQLPLRFPGGELFAQPVTFFCPLCPEEFSSAKMAARVRPWGDELLDLELLGECPSCREESIARLRIRLDGGYTVLREDGATWDGDWRSGPPLPWYRRLLRSRKKSPGQGHEDDIQQQFNKEE